MDTIAISLNTWVARSMLTVNVGQTPGPQFSPRLLWVKPSDASAKASGIGPLCAVARTALMPVRPEENME